jgi:hypothetical protein
LSPSLTARQYRNRIPENKDNVDGTADVQQKYDKYYPLKNLYQRFTEKLLPLEIIVG